MHVLPGSGHHSSVRGDKFCDQGCVVFDADLGNAIFVAVQRQRSRITEIAGGSHGVDGRSGPGSRRVLSFIIVRPGSISKAALLIWANRVATFATSRLADLRVMRASEYWLPRASRSNTLASPSSSNGERYREDVENTAVQRPLPTR